MEAQDQIITFKQYFEEYLLAEVLETNRKGLNSITLDFMKFTEFNLDLAADLENNPTETIKAAEIAVEQIDLPNPVKNFRVRISNLPPSFSKKVAHIRHYDLTKLWCFEGVIRGKTKVFPNVVSSRFECPSCGNIIPVLQLDTKFKEPSRCGCGRKGKFKLISKEFRDVQRLELEELPENVYGNSQPQKLKVVLSDDLVDPNFEKKFNPGCRIRTNGILTEVPIQTRTGAISTDFDFILNSVHIEPIEDEEFETQATPEEKAEFEAIAQKPNFIKKLVDNLDPRTHGHEQVKEALILQLVGGVRKHIEKRYTRGDIHILMIGDPSAGKSNLLAAINQIIPFARKANGKGASGAGLTAAAVKDEFLGGWTLQAGALVLANKSMALIDEFDKMSPEDRDYMHEAMEQQTVTISKANIQATLNSQCSILAAANPKFSKFDPYLKIADQINLPSTLISRFDLIFPLRDEADEVKDRGIAEHIGQYHQGKISAQVELDTSFIRKYIFYAKSFKPRLESNALNMLVDYYVDCRGKGVAKSVVRITARQFEGLIRLTEAYAKLRLSKVADVEDAEKAINMLESYLMEVAYDKETGGFDIHRINADFSASDRNHIKIIRDIINELEDKFKNAIPLEEIVQRASLEKMNEEQVDKAIQRLKKTGDIFIPRSGKISKL